MLDFVAHLVRMHKICTTISSVEIGSSAARREAVVVVVSAVATARSDAPLIIRVSNITSRGFSKCLRGLVGDLSRGKQEGIRATYPNSAPVNYQFLPFFNVS